MSGLAHLYQLDKRLKARAWRRNNLYWIENDLVADTSWARQPHHRGDSTS